MIAEFTYQAGQTPIDPDERAGLIPDLETMDELNEYEQLNISFAFNWAKSLVGRRELLDEGFVRELHRRMFDVTWRWAGTFRKSDKNIGVPWEQIASQVNQLLENARWRRDNARPDPDAFSIQFHFDLVSIHPFPNGNGRHSRLMADLLALSFGRNAFTWGAGGALTGNSAARTTYLQAIYDASRMQTTALLAFARS